MPISINGTGSITGLSAGGLPDNSIVTADIADSAVTYAKLSTSATEADNVAKRTAKAWVNFNGTGTVAIRDSFNVSSITDNGQGRYTLNLAVSLSSANFALAGNASYRDGTDDGNGGVVSIRRTTSATISTSAVPIQTNSFDALYGTIADFPLINAIIIQ